VVRDGLRLLRERDEAQDAKLVVLRRDIYEEFAAIERGEYVSGPAAFAM